MNPPQEENLFSSLFLSFLPFLSSLFPSAHHYSCVFIFHSKRSTLRPNPGVYEVTGYLPMNNTNYNATILKNDIAVAKLAAFSKYPPLRIQTPELSTLSEPGKTVTEVGWGAMVSAKL